MAGFEVKDLSADSFNRALMDSIVEGLSTLGSSPRDALFKNLEAVFQMKKEDIPQNLTAFTGTLETIFGSGSRCLETVIAERLCKKLGLDSGKLKANDLVANIQDLKRQVSSNGERI